MKDDSTGSATALRHAPEALSGFLCYDVCKDNYMREISWSEFKAERSASGRLSARQIDVVDLMHGRIFWGCLFSFDEDSHDGPLWMIELEGTNPSPEILAARIAYGAPPSIAAEWDDWVCEMDDWGLIGAVADAMLAENARS